MLLLLVLAVPPPPSSAYVQIRNQGADAGSARIINFTGSGVACAVEPASGLATIIINAPGSSDAGSSSIAIPACAAGYVLDADGGVLYCINTIANATLAATATALASNPTDCSSGQYANAIAASGNLTCSAVATSQLSGTITNAQLASLYSGVGACSAHNWASTLVSNSAPTCTQPAYSDLSGTPLAGGSVPQVQYNADGGLGGITNVTSDGTRFNITSESTQPASPSTGALHYDWAPSAAFPPVPFLRDSFTSTPIPEGIMGIFGEGSGAGNWMWQCARASGYNLSIVGMNTSVPTSSNWASFATTWKADAGLDGRIYWVTSTPASGNVGSLLQPAGGPWIGNVAGAGGFVFWTRVEMAIAPPHGRWLFGLYGAAATAPVFATEPSANAESVYFGCDNGSSPPANLSICSSGSTTPASCTSLGSNFPCRAVLIDGGTDQAANIMYDMWLAAGPQALLQDGGSGVGYYIERLDTTGNSINTVNTSLTRPGSDAVATGTITSSLPDNYVQFRWLDWFAQGADGGSLTVNQPIARFHGACIAQNQ